VAKPRILLTFLLILFLLLGTTSCLDLEGIEQTADSDGDGWLNDQENLAGTDPDDVDTDDDGYWDPHDPNPLDPNIPEPSTTSATIPTPAETPEEPDTTTTPAITPDTAAEEFRQVQDAVKAMMENNDLTRLEHPVRIPTNDMRRFPDGRTRHGIAGVGYVLYLHDFNGDGKPDINYIRQSVTSGTYICDEYGNVTQITTGYE